MSECESWSWTTNRSSRGALERALKLDGYEVALAPDGEDALVALGAPYDPIVSTC